MTLFDLKLFKFINMKIWHNTSKVLYGEFMFVPIKKLRPSFMGDNSGKVELQKSPSPKETF